MAVKPCLGCGQLTRNGSRCKRCAAASPYRTKAWRRLSADCIRRDTCCVECGTTESLMAHHVIGRRDGGPDELDNLKTLCGSCHARLEARLRAE